MRRNTNCKSRSATARSPQWVPILGILLLLSVGAGGAAAQQRVEKNLVYGMYSGLALLMDVYHPQTPNGRGVVFISGSGWQARLTYGAPQLKEGQIPTWSPALLQAGYTIFAINHRAAPRFQYPAAVEDVQRAIRFVRHHAQRFGIDPALIGGLGGSSGGHLIGLTTMLAAPGKAGDPDPVNRQPATLQAAVLRAAPTDMAKMIGGSTLGTSAVVSFLGRVLMPNAEDQEFYRVASPIAHVKSSSPPTLLIHGDADDTVPFAQSVAMEAALRSANVPTKLVRVVGGAHGPDFGKDRNAHPQFPTVLRETVAWLDLHLKRSTSSR